DATLLMMKARKTCLVPTYAVLERNAATGGPELSAVVAARSRAELPVMAGLSARASKLGVPVVAGSDVRYDDQFSLRQQLAAMIAVGMSPAAVIRSATSVAARCLSIQNRTGRIRAGLEADLVVVRQNPLRSIDALDHVVLVINDGAVAVDNRGN
ncbi:MAG: amidohydrolase family protein, partial [Actinomycetota bacterium]